MSECSGCIKNVKKVSLILNEEEQQEDHGLTGLSAADKQSGTLKTPMHISQHLQALKHTKASVLVYPIQM